MINVAVSCNKEFLIHTKTMLSSLLSNTSEDVTVFILNTSLLDEDLYYLADLSKKYFNAFFKTVQMPEDVFTPDMCNYPIEMLNRILLPYILPDNIDRVLWLDSDIIVKKDISSFYHKDFNTQILACADCVQDDTPSLEIITRSTIRKIANTESNYIYFNSGVLLFNIPLIRNSISYEDCKKLINLLLPGLKNDQDFLNIIFCRSVTYEDPYLYNCNLNYPKDTWKDATIFHYVGPKPYLENFGNAFSYYWDYRREIE